VAYKTITIIIVQATGARRKFTGTFIDGVVALVVLVVAVVSRFVVDDVIIVLRADQVVGDRRSEQ